MSQSLRMPVVHDVAQPPFDITSQWPDSEWDQQTAYDPNTQQRYTPKCSPNAGFRIWRRDEPGCDAVHNAFKAFMLEHVSNKADSLEFCDELTLLRYLPGDSVRVHVDNGGVKRDERGDKRAAFTALWYVSDAALLGGEFILPEAGIILPATFGTRVLIDAGEPHGVNNVLQAERRVIMLRLWYRETEKTSPVLS